MRFHYLRAILRSCSSTLLFLRLNVSYSLLTPSSRLSRRTCTPHALQEPVLLRQPVHAVVALGSRSYESTQSIDLVLAGVSSILVHFAEADLHGGVVFGFDDAVGCAALAGDVAVGDLSVGLQR